MSVLSSITTCRLPPAFSKFQGSLKSCQQRPVCQVGRQCGTIKCKRQHADSDQKLAIREAKSSYSTQLRADQVDKSSAAQQQDKEADIELDLKSRRAVVLGILAVNVLANVRGASAAGSFTTYKDERDNFTISIPEGWLLNEAQSSMQGTGPTATRRTLAWFEESNPATYITATVTNVGADYTSLGSFGTAEQFGSSLVASMDQTFLRRTRFGKRAQNMQEARLVNARDIGDMFNIEYIIKRSEEDERHLLSVIALGYNGRYTRLYTVTAQASEAAFPQEKAILQRILASFQAPNPRL